MTFITLTKPCGNPAYILIPSIVMVEGARLDNGEDVTLLTIAHEGMHTFVRVKEPPDVVMERLAE